MPPVFHNERLTGAVLDRLTQHVHILEMHGESHRLRQSVGRRKKATAVTAAAASMADDPAARENITGIPACRPETPLAPLRRYGALSERLGFRRTWPKTAPPSTAALQGQRLNPGRSSMIQNR